MIDFEGKTWTRDGNVLTCDDGRVISIVAAMTDAYLMALVQRLHVEYLAQKVLAEDLVASRLSAQAEAVAQYLLNHTPAEVEAYVMANVTDLASAKAMLAKVAMVVTVLVKREFR